MKNQNNQLLKLWFLQATETLCHLSVTDIKKRFCNVWFFCINEACVNCGKENATTLTWLLLGGKPINHRGLPPRFLGQFCEQSYIHFYGSKSYNTGCAICLWTIFRGCPEVIGWCRNKIVSYFFNSGIYLSNTIK